MTGKLPAFQKVKRALHLSDLLIYSFSVIGFRFYKITRELKQSSCKMFTYLLLFKLDQLIKFDFVFRKGKLDCLEHTTRIGQACFKQSSIH